MTPEEQKLIDKATEALKRLEELQEGKPVKDCTNCKNGHFGFCEVFGTMIFERQPPRPFYCNQYELKP